MDDQETVEMLERLGGDVLSPTPAVAGLVTRGRAGRRRRARLRATGALAAALVVVAGVVAFVPHGERAASVATPAGVHVVTDPAAVVGRWLVVSVDGSPPPDGAQRELDLSLVDAGLDASYESGVNSYDVTWSIGSDGRLTVPEMFQTEVGCGDPCGQPGGFGVDDAAALGLTDDGDLVLIGDDGSELAVYERPHPALDPGTRVVTRAADLLGRWLLVGQPPGVGGVFASSDVTFEQAGDTTDVLRVLFVDGYGDRRENTVTVRPTGQLVLGVARPAGTSLLMGCRSRCDTGQGLGGASLLGLTTDGRLVLLDDDGAVRAVYEPEVPRADVAHPDARVVIDPQEVLGSWRVLSVEGHAPPAHAIRDIDISLYGKQPRLLLFVYSYGPGSANITSRMSPTGELHGGMSTSVGVGCNAPCGRPSGFGVGDATQLRLTKDGRLILVGANGRELAVYERTS